MIRPWIALVLLAGSWLLGLHYHRPASWLAWAASVLVGTLLLARMSLRLPGRREAGLALLMLLPAVWLVPWPHRAAPLAVAAGLALHLVPVRGRWPQWLARAAVAAGLILLVQGLAIAAYTWQTARNHDLPWPLAALLGTVASLLGIDAAVDGSAIAIYTLREVHRLGATWDLLVDPPSLAFLAGGIVLVGLAAWSRFPAGERRAPWLRSVRTLAIIVAAWLPVRAAFLIALWHHRAVRAETTARLNLMDQFFSPWLDLGLLCVPALLAWRFVPVRSDEAARSGRPDAPTPADPGSRWRYPAAVGLVALGVAALVFVVGWDPVGGRQEGRITFVERHSSWEPTTFPYDATTLGKTFLRRKTTDGKEERESSSYTYAAMYDYCSRFYATSRLLEAEAIDARRLRGCDVLVIKTPTARYAPEEVEAVVRFVQRGGGLLLIADHTDFDKSTSYLNDVAGHFGFKFRKDLLLSIGEPTDTYEQHYAPPVVPHPVVEHVPPMTFAVSCSIDPAASWGTPVIRSTGLWSLPPLYRSENYFPEAELRSDMRFGAFIQLWAARQGRGRVLAWTDSTIFSNFSAFEPGKAELMLGMLEWLNRRSVLDPPEMRWPAKGAAALVGLALCCGGLWLAWVRQTAPLVVLAAALLGWTAASTALVLGNRLQMPPPEPNLPMVRVTIDRTVSKVPLSRGGFTEKDGDGYGLLEQWIPRLGYFPARRRGLEVFSSDVLVVICPTKSVPEAFRERLAEFVAAGGKLLVIDSPVSSGSTANSLLWPFGLSVSHAASREGKLGTADGWPGIAVSGTCRLSGGTPLLWVDGMPVAARTGYGQGKVMAIGFGAVFNDEALGSSLSADPTPDILARGDLLFALLRDLVEGKPIGRPAARQPDPPLASPRGAEMSP